MKEMNNGINIDKWRKLNNDLFDSYIRAYSLLSQDSSLNADTVMMDSLAHFNILKKVTPGSYGTIYTIARELGIFYEEKDKFFLGELAELYSNKTISFSDYMKYYILNTEFLIYDKVVHPFLEIINSLFKHSKTLNEIAQECPNLIVDPTVSSTKTCLKYFLDRCCLSELIEEKDGYYSLSYQYNKFLILGSINRTNLSETEFKEKFISSKDARSNKTIVETINKKIPTLLQSILPNHIVVPEKGLEKEKGFESFLVRREISLKDINLINIDTNIQFNIGQPNTGKSYDFEESRIFDGVKSKYYKYLKIPVSGGVGNEYKGLQNTDLAITYDPIKKELRFGEFLQMLMSAIVNPGVPHVVFLDDFHNQDISSLLSEYTPLFKGQQKRTISNIDATSSIYNNKFENTDNFIEQWNDFISIHCADVPTVPLTNRISGDSLKLVYPDNFYLLGAANFNENSLNIFADWEDRASITYINPIENFEKNFKLAADAEENTKQFFKCCKELNSQLKEILKDDHNIFNYKQYCFGMWKIVDSKSEIITNLKDQKKVIDFFFSMIKNSLKFNNKTSDINDIGKNLIEKMQQSENIWFKKNIEPNMSIDKEILHKHNIYEDEI